MVDLSSIIKNSEDKSWETAVEEAAQESAAPVLVAPVVSAPVVSAPATGKPAVGSGWEVAPGIWQIVVPVSGAFTLPDGRGVRPVETDGVARAAVPVEWIDYVKAL